jgi:hypothetical protein
MGKTKTENKLIICTIILTIILLIMSCLSFYYFVMYHASINAGVKYTVTALEMVVACQQVGNVTPEQTKEQFIKTFILNQSKGAD